MTGIQVPPPPRRYDSRTEYERNRQIEAADLSNLKRGADIDFRHTFSAVVRDNGGAVFNVKHPDYGATGDGATDDTAAIQAAIDAMEASGGKVILPFTSTGYLVSSPLTVSGRRMHIDGMGSTIFCNDLTGPILDMTIDYSVVENLTVQYTSTPGASNTAASGFYIRQANHCEFNSLRALRTYRGFHVPGAEIGGTQIFFSNTISNLVIRDFEFSAIKIHIGSAGANTGNAWNNIYINGKEFDSATHRNVTGPYIQLLTTHQDVFNQLNIEWGTLTNSNESFFQIERGAVVVNSMHVEGTATTLNNPNVFWVTGAQGTTLTVNGLSMTNQNWSGTGWGNLIKIGNDDVHAQFIGTNIIDTTNTWPTNGIRPAWTGGSSRAGCKVRMENTYSADLVYNVAGLTTSTGRVLYFDTEEWTVTTFTSGDATPNVGAGGKFFKTAGTTAITDFDNGGIGQTLVIAAQGNITVTHNAAVRLQGSTNYLMKPEDTLTLTMFDDQVWHEVARTVVSRHLAAGGGAYAVAGTATTLTVA